MCRGYAGQCREAEKPILPLLVSAKNVTGLIGAQLHVPEKLYWNNQTLIIYTYSIL